MRQKIPALFISLLAAIFVANAINKALPVEPQRLQYDHRVTLTGTLTREFDMAFVDSDMSPVKDPAAAEKAAAEAQRKHPGDAPGLHAPIPHLILHLDKPLSVREGTDDGLHPAIWNISEIDLGDIPSGRFHIYAEALGNGRYMVTGMLSHAQTVHHLRQIMMQVDDIKPAAR